MLTDLQQEFCARFRPGDYDKFLTTFESLIGTKILFRVCEAPIFVAHSFRLRLEEAAKTILMQCLQPEYLQRSDATLEARYTVAGQDEKPLFSVVDFAVTQTTDGDYQPKLIELQGFPSLFGYQFLFAITARDFYRLPESLEATFSGISETEYIDLLKTAILGEHDPDQVALLEFDPDNQKTRPDFLALERLIGIQTSDIRSVRKEGNRLLHLRNGVWTPIRRVFNRAIIDELDEQQAEIPFQWNDELDLEWAGHPNWYFRISKFTLPFLHHPSVPRSYRLDKLDNIPADLQHYVLKPLYSFAGKGVNVFPTQQDVEELRHSQADKYVLQEKVQYSKCVPTPEGLNKVEIRVLLLWLPSWDEPLPVMSLARTGRGPMMGVRYNSVPWSGSSGCLFL